MQKFNQFNIKPTSKGFEGDKIKMSKILNKEIVVHDFKVEDSKCFKDRGNGKCLHLQVSINGDKHIIFTSATGLIEIIQQVPVDGFPFSTTIIQEGERYLFT
jgi:hypothetical protein